MEETNKSGFLINLSDLWAVFRRTWIVLLAIALLIGTGTGLYLYLSHRPVYTAKGSIWVMREAAEQRTATSDVSIANYLIFDVADTLRTYDVREKVIEVTNSSRTPEELAKMISISDIPEDATTHIVNFSVTSPNAAEAKQLAEAFVTSTCDKINNELFAEEPYTKRFDSVITPTAPSNPVRRQYIFLAGGVAAVLAYLIFLLIHLLDGRVSSERELTQALGIPLLGEIPNRGDSRRHHKKYGRYYAYAPKDEKEGESK